MVYAFSAEYIPPTDTLSASVTAHCTTTDALVEATGLFTGKDESQSGDGRGRRRSKTLAVFNNSAWLRFSSGQK